MSAQIDLAGTYRGPIAESAVDTTKNGFPKWVARLSAAEKWVDDPEGMEHFGLSEPGWVDWEAFNESTVAHFVLFKANVVEGEQMVPGENDLLNYEQLKRATGWSGVEFDSLNDDTLIGHKILFRMAENEWDGKTRIQAEWIDEFDAPVNRELKKLDSEGVAGLNKLFAGKKPVAKPASKPSSKAAPSTKNRAKAAPATTPAPPQTDAPETPPQTDAPEAPTDEGAVLNITSDDPAEVQLQVWGAVCANKGDNDDQTVQDAWIEACQQVGGDKEETQFTVADWEAVGKAVLRSLAT